MEEKQANAIVIDDMKEKRNLNWTSWNKKHAIYTVKEAGVEKSLPIMVHLRQVATSLPPMNNSEGRRVYHFENIRRRFMSGSTREDSMRLVNEYCSEVMEIWNESIKKLTENESNRI